MSGALIFKSVRTGLANRLRALVGYQALSHFLNLPFRLCWVPNDECDAAFDWLFDATIDQIRIEELDTSRSEYQVHERSIWFHDIWADHLQQSVPREVFIARVRRHLDELTPSGRVRDKVAKYLAEVDLSDSLGVHIRHTDNLTDYQRHAWRSPTFEMRRISTMAGYLHGADVHVTRGRIFLATDDPLIERMFSDRYGDKLLIYPKRYLDGGLRTSAVVDALVEMTLLGACESILGTYYSSFSKFSAIWTGTPFREVIGERCEPSEFVNEMLRVMPAPTRLLRAVSETLK